MNFSDLLLSGGEDSANALLYKEGVVTYGELRDKVRRLAAGLLARGHRKGDRIGISSENSPFFVVCYLATIRAGLVAVPCQVDMSPEDLGKVVSNAGIREVFVSNRCFNRLRVWAETRGLRLASERELETLFGNSAAVMPEIDPRRDLAALMFTSGSTGEPKGVMVSHGNIECNTRDIAGYLGLTAEDRAMVVLPLHYCFGASLLHTHLLAGGSVVLNNDFRLYPETVLQEMQGKACTGLAGVPSTYQILLRKSRFRQMAFPKLRWLQQAGGKLPDACIRELIQAFPTVSLFIMYGQTEGTARLSYLPPERLGDKLGSIGRGLPSTRIEVLKADGSPVARGKGNSKPETRTRDQPRMDTDGHVLEPRNTLNTRKAAGETNFKLEISDLKVSSRKSKGEDGGRRTDDGEVGEIVASGDNIALGYWNDSVETGKFFRDGKLYTGDLARVDEDGFIFIVEREREMIKSGGNRVSAKEVESVIAEMPEVVEVAVVGAPHELLGEAIKAFVVLAPGPEILPECVLRHCLKRMPMFKVPEEVIFLSTMPHNSSGKIMKPRLKDMLREPQLRGTVVA